MSSFHTHSSWGRTRRPKNITGTDGTPVLSQDPSANNNDDDITRNITSVQAFTADSITINVEAFIENVFSAGDMVQISVGPQWLRTRMFRVTVADFNNNRITIHLDEEAAHYASMIPPDRLFVADSANGLVLAGADALRKRTTLGYRTENQRFLHLTCVGQSVTKVHIYNYSVGKWAEIFDVITDERGEDQGVGAEADLDDAVIRKISYVVANGEHRILDIAGDDRVAITCSGANGVWAATSTF